MTFYSYTVGEAYDALYGTFFNAWDDSLTGWRFVLPGVSPGDPTAPVVVFDQEEPEIDPPITAPNVYAYIRHTTGAQASLRGENGRRWQRTGFVLHRLHFPSDMPLITGNALVKVIVDAYQGKRGFGAGAGIIFPTVRPLERGASVDRYKFDVIASFQYDELI